MLYWRTSCHGSMPGSAFSPPSRVPPTSASLRERTSLASSASSTSGLWRLTTPWVSRVARCRYCPTPIGPAMPGHASKSNYGSTESSSSPTKDVPSSHRTLPQVPLLSVPRTGHSAMVTKTLLEAWRPSAPRLYLENQPPTTPGEGPSKHPPGQIH